MIITVASYKGGVGKTTTAIHLAACLHKRAPTLLIDGDSIRASIKWSQRGRGFPFKVADETQGIKAARDYQENGHIVIDTGANPSDVDFRAVADGCDLLVIPAVPQTTATDGLTETLKKLVEIENNRYRVLITMVPPRSAAARELRRELDALGVPVFASEIPRLQAFDTASGQGVIVHAAKDDYAKTAWAAYQAAGKEIVNG